MLWSTQHVSTRGQVNISDVLVLDILFQELATLVTTVCKMETESGKMDMLLKTNKRTKSMKHLSLFTTQNSNIFFHQTIKKKQKTKKQQRIKPTLWRFSVDVYILLKPTLARKIMIKNNEKAVTDSTRQHTES